MIEKNKTILYPDDLKKTVHHTIYVQVQHYSATKFLTYCNCELVASADLVLGNTIINYLILLENKKNKQNYNY